MSTFQVLVLGATLTALASPSIAQVTISPPLPPMAMLGTRATPAEPAEVAGRALPTGKAELPACVKPAQLL